MFRCDMGTYTRRYRGASSKMFPGYRGSTGGRPDTPQLAENTCGRARPPREHSTESLAMNKSVAEAARRVFGNLPHSKGRSGNKVLRKNMIGRKIAEVCSKCEMVCYQEQLCTAVVLVLVLVGPPAL